MTRISANPTIDANCQITVTDTSPWQTDPGDPYLRTNYALAMFWQDPITLTWYSDLTNPVGSWPAFQTLNNGWHHIEVFSVSLYNPASALNIGYSEIYFDTADSCFYVFLGGVPWVPNLHPGETPASDAVSLTPEWFIADDIDLFLDQKIGLIEWSGWINVECVLPDISMTKTTCDSWEICNEDVNLSYGYMFYSVTDLVTPIEQAIITDECVTITAPADGAYIIQVYSMNGTTYDQVLNTYIVYSFCHLEACIESLTKQILCNDWDPCCTSCSAEQKREWQIKRDHLNMMIALQGRLFYLLNQNSIYCMFSGMLDPTSPNINENITDNAAEMIQIIERLAYLTGRCGQCEGTQTTSTSGCTDCGK